MQFKQKLAYIALVGLLVGAFLLLPNTLVETAVAAQIVRIGTAASDVIVVVVETGPDEDMPTQELNAWRVDGGTAKAVGRWSYPWDEGPCEDWGNAIYPITMRHHFYIQVNAPLVNDQVYSITTPFGVKTLAFHDHLTFCESIKVNQAGYYSRSTIRYANLGVYLGDLGPRLLKPLPHYEVMDENSNKVVLSGQAVYWGDDTALDRASGEYVYRLNLASLPDGGPYYISVLGFGRSYSFGVGAEYSKQLAYIHTRGLYHQRCGIALEEPYTIFTRGACHTTVEVTDAEPPEQIPGTEHGPVMKIRGGYHDAGDFDRRLSHTLIPAWMLNLYEAFPERFPDNQFNIPESGNGIPDWLDEALWGILVWEYLQDEDGGVRAGTETDRDVIYGEVNAETDALVYRTYRKDGHTTASAAGLFAHASRLVAPFDSSRATELLARAIKAWNYVQTHNLPTAHAAQKMYAALQLYLATGDAVYHDAFRANANQLLSKSQWPEQYHPLYFNLGTIQDGMIFAPYFFAYLLTDKAINTSLRNQFIELLRTKAYEMINDLNSKPYPMGPAPGLAWGTATNQGRYAEPVMLMYRLTGEQKYLDAVSQLADYAIGLNPIGKVYVTGIGANPPNNPCHLDSYFTRQRRLGNVPGIVVYGPMVEPSSVGYQFAVWSKVYPAWKELPHQRRYCEGWSLIPVNEFGTWETITLNACLHAFLNDTPLAPPVNVPIYPITLSTSVSQSAGVPFWVDVKVGDDKNPVNDLFSVSFKLNYTKKQIIDPVQPIESSVESGDLMGKDVVLNVQGDDNAGQITITISRKAGTSGIQGSGVIAKIKLTSIHDIAQDESIILSLSNITAKNSKGEDILFSPQDTKLTITKSGIVVWSGDTNNDGIVDERDVLPIGIYWAKSGTPRPNASIQWVAQPVTPWTPEVATYADSNGDGIVDERDVLAIGMNWHKKHELGASGAPMIASIYSTKLDHARYLKAYQAMYQIIEGRPDIPQELKGSLNDLITIARASLPKENALEQNYPNPFNPETWIPYQLCSNSQVAINIYDPLGKLIRSLELGMKDAGIYFAKDRAAYWDGRSDAGEKVASGIYFYWIQAGNFTAIRKMILVK